LSAISLSMTLAVAWAPALVSPAATPFRQCEGPDVHPWVADFRSRIESYDDLYRFAVERFGPPVACEGAIGDEFDGMLFGSLRFTFAGGVTYAIETMPIETSVSVMRHPSGFGDPAATREALAADARGTGLRIDWSAAPEITEEDGETIHSYGDPEPGLNASASLIYRGDALVGIRLSMAL
jgi:hypothetical protein